MFLFCFCFHLKVKQRTPDLKSVNGIAAKEFNNICDQKAIIAEQTWATTLTKRKSVDTAIIWETKLHDNENYSQDSLRKQNKVPDTVSGEINIDLWIPVLNDKHKSDSKGFYTPICLGCK